MMRLFNMKFRNIILQSVVLPLSMGMLGAGIVITATSVQETDQDVVQLDRPFHVKKVNYSPSVPAMPGFRAIADRATSSVVKVRTLESMAVRDERSPDGGERYFFGTGSGSGVIYQSDGFIITNRHVIKDASDIEVELADGRRFAAELVGQDDRTDLAMLKIEARGLSTLPLGNSDDLVVGDWVLAIGNPFEYLTSTVTAGIVSALGRDIDIIRSEGNIEAFIQTDAVVNPGSSGGALIDAKGQLIGINTAIATPSSTYTGYSFAIPVNLMRKIANDLIAYGSYRRAMLGVQITRVDADQAADRGLLPGAGVLVSEVQVGGAADRAGIEPGDVLLSVNDKALKSVPQLQAMIGGLSAGDAASMEVVTADGDRKTVDVMLTYLQP